MTVLYVTTVLYLIEEPFGLSMVYQLATGRNLLAISSKKTKLAVFSALHKVNLGLEIQLISPFFPQNLLAAALFTDYQIFRSNSGIIEVNI